MAAPTMTYGAAGNLRADAALAAGASASVNVDAQTYIEAQITIKNTPGATVAATRGVRVDVYPRYSTTPVDTTIAAYSVRLDSAAASTPESRTIFLGTGKWKVTITNLDATNAVTVEITGDYVTGIT